MSQRKHNPVPIYVTFDMFEPQTIFAINTAYIFDHPELRGQDVMQLLNEMAEVQTDFNAILFDEYYSEKYIPDYKFDTTMQVLRNFDLRLMSLRRLYCNLIFSQN